MLEACYRSIDLKICVERAFSMFRLRIGREFIHGALYERTLQ